MSTQDVDDEAGRAATRSALDLWAALAGDGGERREAAYRRVCVLLQRAEEDQRRRVGHWDWLAQRAGTKVARERASLEAAMETGSGVVRLLTLLRRHLDPGRIGDARVRRGAGR